MLCLGAAYGNTTITNFDVSKGFVTPPRLGCGMQCVSDVLFLPQLSLLNRPTFDIRGLLLKLNRALISLVNFIFVRH